MKRLKVVQHSTFVYLVVCNRSLILYNVLMLVDEGSQVYMCSNGPQEDGSTCKGQVGKYMCNTLLLQKCACARLQVCYWVEKRCGSKIQCGLVELAGVMAFCIS